MSDQPIAETSTW